MDGWLQPNVAATTNEMSSSHPLDKEQHRFLE